MTNDGPRLLQKDIDCLMLEVTVPSPLAVQVIEGGSNWQFEIVVNTLQLTWNGYIDLAGYVRDERTWFPSGCQFQDSFPWGLATQPDPLYAGTSYTVHDLVSDQPLEGWDSSIFTVPGFIGSQEQMSNIIYGSYRTFIYTTTTGSILNPSQSGRFGTGMATASDRIYIRREVGIARDPNTEGWGVGDRFRIPACHVLIPGVVAEEPDLIYIDRLRRSYELQQQPDVD